MSAVDGYSRHIANRSYEVNRLGLQTRVQATAMSPWYLEDEWSQDVVVFLDFQVIMASRSTTLKPRMAMFVKRYPESWSLPVPTVSTVSSMGQLSTIPCQSYQGTTPAISNLRMVNKLLNKLVNKGLWGLMSWLRMSLGCVLCLGSELICPGRQSSKGNKCDAPASVLCGLGQEAAPKWSDRSFNLNKRLYLVG